MVLKIFTQPNCPKCQAAKKLAAELRIKNKELRVEKFDTATVEGMAEGAFYQVMGTPTVLLCDDNGKVVAEWRGEAPTMANLKLKLKTLNFSF